MFFLFFARVIVGIYAVGAVAIFAVIVSDAATNRRIAKDQETKIGVRILSAFAWPILILSRSGRRLLTKSWKGVF